MFYLNMQQHLNRTGYLLCRNLVSVENATAEMNNHFPNDVEIPVEDFGSGNTAIFPSTPALNLISVDTTILKIVRKLLNTDKVILTQSVPWAKYGRPAYTPASNRDQRIHMDYGNNQFTMPMPNKPPVTVAAIVYYSDTSKTGGATAIVPRTGPDDPVYTWPYTHMPGISGKPFANRRKEAEELMSIFTDSTEIREQCYSREIVPTFKPGDVLFYRTDTWHRGTPVKEGQIRYVHNLAWRRADATDIQQWNPGFTQKMYSGDFERFISEIEPGQLETLGFTTRDDPRWKNEMFVAAMNHRYQWAGFDAKKYMKYEDPPQVPRFWQFAPLTLRSTASAVDVREKLFLILNDLDVDVEVISSLWKYRFQKVCGSVYLDIQCHFFTQDSEIAVDINLLSGDRFVWRDLAQNIRVMFNGGQSKGECRQPRDFQLKPEQLFQLLEHGSLNDKRIAMRSLALSTCNVDIRKIEPWLQKPTGSFLEKEIRRWAEYIKVNRAHL